MNKNYLEVPLVLPVEGVEAQKDALEEMAWAIIQELEEKSIETVTTDYATYLQGILCESVSIDRCHQCLFRWITEEHPLRWVRKGKVPTAPVMLEEESIEEFISLLLRDSQSEAMRMCVSAGMSMQEAKKSTKLYSIHRDQCLPNGQWLTGEQLDRINDKLQLAIEEGGQVSIHGFHIPSALFKELVDLAVIEGKKIQAVKRVRAFLREDLRTSLDIINEIIENPDLLQTSRKEKLRKAVVTQNKEARVRLDACIRELLMSHPFYWLVLSEALIVEDMTLSSIMAVGLTQSSRIVLFYHPDEVLSLKREHCKGVIVHEIHHILFGHLSDHHPDATSSPFAWRVACECTANEFVPFALPGNPITIETVGIPPNESTFRRFERLKKREDRLQIYYQRINQNRPWFSALQDMPTDHKDRVFGKRAFLPTSLLKDAADLAAGEANDKICQTLSEAMKNQGISDVGAIALALSPEGISQLPWPTLLRQTLHQRRVVYATRRYPNRRHPHRIGVIPGKRTRLEKKTILAAIDTSMSMTNEELTQAVDELLALLREEGSKILCVQCDTDIRDMRWLQPSDRLTQIFGRGGTDLRPPFEASLLLRHNVSTVVYFTDGYGPAPTVPPPNVDVLWVLTGQSPCVPADYGQKVCLRPRSQRNRIKEKV